MQVNEVGRKAVSPGKVISVYDTEKVKLKLTATFGNQAALDELIFMLACQKIKGKIAGNA